MPNRVFVIEDDLASRYAYERALKAAGYETAGFGCYFTAATEIDKGAGALLVVDIRLPRGTPHGLSVARIARNHRPGLPVIFITGDLEMGKMVSEFGPVMFKPLNLDELVAMVGGLLAASAASKRREEADIRTQPTPIPPTASRADHSR